MAHITQENMKPELQKSSGTHMPKGKMGDQRYLTGKLLLAMPSMADPRFHRAVIFMCAHDVNGAMGLVINQKLSGVEFSDLLEQLRIASNIQVNINPRAIPVMSGGPVEGSRGFLLHTGDFKLNDTVTIDESYGVTGTIDALKAVAQGQGPQNLLFILGYAGWGAGQLDQELQDNAWLVAEPDPEIIFQTSPEQKWELAARKLGIDPAMLSTTSGRA